MKKFKYVRGTGAGARAGGLNKFQHVQEVPMWSGGAGAQVDKLEDFNKGHMGPLNVDRQNDRQPRLKHYFPVTSLGFILFNINYEMVCAFSGWIM